MDNFKTFLEDLASGRPAKKPVSSNLLKQRAKDNEKALKSGFMKMPDYVKKKFNEEEEMKPHKMYKGDKVVMAKNKAEHDKLNKQGYTHDNPKTKKVEEAKEMCSCDCDCGKAICESCGKPKKQINEISLKLMGKHARASIKQVGQMQKLKDDPKTPSAVKKAADQTIRKRSKGLDKTWGSQNESTRDKYNPKISDIRNKEKMKKVGLPAGKGPLVQDENILEVSDSLKSRYIARANMEISNLEKAKDSAHKDMGKDSAPVEKHMDKKATKRRKGVQQARKDLKRPKKFNTSKNMWEEKQKGIDGKVCWKGYKRMGTKKKGGKTVDNCVKVEDFVLDAFENYYLTELSPKTISSYQKKAGKQYRDLKKSTPSRQGIENAYHQGYTSDKEYFKQHDDRDKLEKRGKGLAASKGKGVQKEDSNWPRPFTKPERNEFLKKKHIQKVKPSTNRAGNSAIKEGAFKRKLTSKQEADRLNDKAHAALGYKKTSDSGLKKVKGGYERKRTYTREEQIQLMTNLDLDESIGNLVRRGVGKVQDAIKQAEKKHGPVDPAKRNIPNPVSGDNIAKRLYGKSQKKRLMK